MSALPVMFFTALTLVINGPYLLRAIQRKFVPHFLTWYPLALFTGAVAVRQLMAGESIAWVAMMVAATMNALIATFALRGWLHMRRDPLISDSHYISRSDIISSAAALGTFALSFVVPNPDASIAFLGLASLITFWPTLRRAMTAKKLADLEPKMKFAQQTYRYMLAVSAIQTFTFTTAFYPLLWVGMNGFVAIFLAVRERQLTETTSSPTTLEEKVTDLTTNWTGFDEYPITGTLIWSLDYCKESDPYPAHCVHLTDHADGSGSPLAGTASELFARLIELGFWPVGQYSPGEYPNRLRRVGTDEVYQTELHPASGPADALSGDTEFASF